jgi:diguanylate cyclase (GGDEF)-like protein
MLTFGHVFNRQSFLLLLELEVKRAQRYQDYLSLLSLTFGHLNPSLGKNPSISFKTLAKLLKDELRDSDIVGEDTGNRFIIMLPHADMARAHRVRERLERILQDYGFAEKGLTMEIDEVCFPTHATSVYDLLQLARNNVPDGRL